jgi:hypothetical protein
MQPKKSKKKKCLLVKYAMDWLVKVITNVHTVEQCSRMKIPVQHQDHQVHPSPVALQVHPSPVALQVHPSPVVHQDLAVAVLQRNREVLQVHPSPVVLQRNPVALQRNPVVLQVHPSPAALQRNREALQRNLAVLQKAVQKAVRKALSVAHHDDIVN